VRFRKEIWLDIRGHEGLYQVSDLGHVRSLDRVVNHRYGGVARRKGKRLQLNLNTAGYYCVLLCGNGKPLNVPVHKLVTSTFLGPCPEGQQVRHGPKGKQDNSLLNLSYGTSSQNQLDKRRDGTHKGTPVLRSDGIRFINMAVAAESIDGHATNICAVCKCKGNHKTAGGHGWKYA